VPSFPFTVPLVHPQPIFSLGISQRGPSFPLLLGFLQPIEVR